MPPLDLDLLRADDSQALHDWIEATGTREIADELTRLSPAETAVVFRLLPRDRALEVFEVLDPHDQQQVLDGLRDDRVISLVEAMEADDRARLLDELPAGVAARLISQLSPEERDATALLLGYPEDSAGRMMNPEYVSLRASMTAAEAMARIRRESVDAETIYALPVLDDARRLIGITGLRKVIISPDDTRIGDVMTTDVHSVTTDTDREVAARLVREEGLIALPVVDSEQRLVGVVTVDDAMRVLEDEETEDFAIQGASVPLGRPYLSSSAMGLARVRAVWLLVLILTAFLTVNVLQIFESTLAEVVTLAVFIPLLIGTGGNAGAQASTAVIRALAVGEVRLADLPRVLWRETRTGLFLGLLLALAAFVPVSLIYEPDLALVVSITLIAICTWATAAGSTLPLLARRVGVDPAVVSAPLITTLVDATGLIIYFTVARIVLGI